MTRSLVPVELQTEWLLLESAFVREILGAQAWWPVPHGRPDFPGVIAWRDRAIPVLDLGHALGLRPLAAREIRERTVIVEIDRNVAALPVDAAREVHRLAETDIRPPHARQRPYATAESDARGTLMTLIDLSALFAAAAHVNEGPDAGEV
jgi:two-component system chemotaxis response regulator CheV